MTARTQPGSAQVRGEGAGKIIAPAPPCTRSNDEETASVAGHEVGVRVVLLTLWRGKHGIVERNAAQVGNAFRRDGRDDRRVNTDGQTPKNIQSVNREVDSPLIESIMSYENKRC